MLVMGKEVVERKVIMSESGKEYAVCELSNGQFTCGCPNWVFRRNKPNYTECKHIAEFKRIKQRRIIQEVNKDFKIEEIENGI